MSNKPPHSSHYIGLMSGTSLDGVDVALVTLSGNQCQLIDSYLHPIDKSLKLKLKCLCEPHKNSPAEITPHRVELLAELDHRLGLIFAEAVNQFLEKNNFAKDSIRAIGSHGQTIRHLPTGGIAEPQSSKKYPFSLQIGDPNLIAYHTGITTVADFRRMDMAAGGQGAPLAPAFHAALMRSAQETRLILNLGGIANITLLPKSADERVIGFDTGPANTLLDAHFKQQSMNADDFDRNSQFARKGKTEPRLLKRLLADPYFKLDPPKSTGREYFSTSYLQKHLDSLDFLVSPESVQATLLAFTTQTIADAINQLGLSDYQIYTCGGGMHNHFLIEQLGEKLAKTVRQTNDIGVDGDYLEAMAFAWLAHQRLEHQPGNLPSVTGAREAKVLGAIYLP